ncbi:A24 family peptidase [Nocardioides sp.]|uniref:prepilin peptidase n=1 Tax=Nocardioides sp. TaxID=35761 RepID=UPI003567D2BF
MSDLLPGPIVVATVAALGLAVGSFLNVVVHRVPAGLSVVRPGSACPVCAHPVRERDNIPVVSWLVLRGRCRDCAAPISARYPAVEAGTALLFALIALRLPLTPTLAACLAMAGAGVALALIDLAHQRLPFAVTGVAAVLAATALGAYWVWLGLAAEGSALGAAWAAAWPALAGAAGWLAVYAGIWLLTSGRGMGLGDVALAPVLGLVLGAVGLDASAVGLAAGFALGALTGVVLLATGRAGRRTAIPFGPFMLVGAAVGLFAGAPLAAGYLGLVGLG